MPPVATVTKIELVSPTTLRVKSVLQTNQQIVVKDSLFKVSLYAHLVRTCCKDLRLLFAHCTPFLSEIATMAAPSLDFESL